MTVLEIGTPAFNEFMKAVRIDSDWISKEIAKEMLGGVSDMHLSRLREAKEISYSQPSLKVILYRKSSIEKYLAKHEIKAK